MYRNEVGQITTLLLYVKYFLKIHKYKFHLTEDNTLSQDNTKNVYKMHYLAERDLFNKREKTLAIV